MKITLPKPSFLKHPGVVLCLKYLGLVGLLFSLLSLWDLWLASPYIRRHFIMLSLGALLCGLVNLWLLHKTSFFSVFSYEEKILLTVGGNITGILVYLLIAVRTDLFSTGSLYLSYLPALLLFALPLTLLHSALSAQAIPALEYVPVRIDRLPVANHKFNDRSRGIVWTFEKDFFELHEDGSYRFRTFAPKDLEKIALSDLFEAILSLHNHNERPSSPIRINEALDSYEWSFYHFPHWLFPAQKQPLDPTKTLIQNRNRFSRLSRRKGGKDLIKELDLPARFRTTEIYVTRSLNLQNQNHG